MKAREIIDVMEQHFPLELQEEWDRCGLQIGYIDQEVTKLMIALDPDEQTLDEAIAQGCQMLITHHPFLFHELTLDLSTPTGRFIEKAICHHVVIYSAHTNLDKAAMNKWLVASLGCENAGVIDASEIAQKGILPQPMTIRELIALIKTTWQLTIVKTNAALDDIVHVIGVCGGSGSSLMREIGHKVDVYVTGDFKYHDVQAACENNIRVIDVGHHVEVIMVEKLKEFLAPELNVEIVTGTSHAYFEVV